eukprot:CAMPEP_0173470360 /NCGR_PEP_ID=MMETSP1357-20121228/77838_1 /TAXON_ID=77926 /ORGANISM="Hemiselmis rufescens, Strain PCC563" /LENGTH=1141 /DNA_ID=CAMNT_0014438635 /DNA_START=15 /DNA_END=3438 /DNA_ORIENTATION=+
MVLNSSAFDAFVSVTIVLHCAAINYAGRGVTEAEAFISTIVRVFGCLVILLELYLSLVSSQSLGLCLTSQSFRANVLIALSGWAGIISQAITGGNGPKFLSVVPALRLYRLMEYVPTLRNLLTSTLDASSPMLNLLFFAWVSLFAVAITGRYMLGGDLDPYSRSNFGSLAESLLTSIQLVTGDSWSSVMYDAAASQESEGVFKQVLCVIFVIAWVFFATFILQNLFVSVIIQHFAVTTTIKIINQRGQLTRLQEVIKGAWNKHWVLRRAYERGDILLDMTTGRYVLPTGEEFNPSMHGSSFIHREGDSEQQDQPSEPRTVVDVDSPKPSHPGTLTKTKSARLMAWEAVTREAVAGQVPKKIDPYKGRSLFLFSRTSAIRRASIRILESKAFGALVLSTIAVTCFMMLISPVYRDFDPDPPLVSEHVERLVDYIATGVFLFEFLVHAVAMGLIFTRYAYLKSGWNVLDTFILIFSLFDVITSLLPGDSQDLGIARIFRLARALRPLRLMKRNESMRVIIDALIATLAPVAYVVLFSSVTYVVFALIGMGLLKGRMFRCSGPGAEYPAGLAECSSNWITPESLLMPRAWDKPPHNFDTWQDSVVTLYRISSVKYVAILNDAMDVTDYDKSPLRNNSQFLAIFFVAYLLIGFLFVLNLFVGFIVDGFNLNKGSSKLDVTYTRLSRQFKEHRPREDTLALLKPNNPFCTSLGQFLNGSKFQVFSVGCVFINVGFMLADHADPSPNFQRLMDLQNLVFYFELIAEILLFVIAFGPGALYDDTWKRFDLFVAVGSTLGYIASSPEVTQFVKAFRLLRVVRLMIIIKKIRIIIETLVKCLPQLLNVVVVDGFNLNKGSSTKDIIYARFMRQFRDRKPRTESLLFLKPANLFSEKLGMWLSTLRFQVFSATCVTVNVGFMLADHVDPEPWFQDVMDRQNLFFFLELVGEIFLYCLAFGPGALIDDVWKNFDMFVCVGTLLGYLFETPQLTQFVKSFRLLRVVRLMIIIKKIRIILETLVKCIPQLLNIVVLLFLVYSMFSVLGLTLFAATKYGVRLGPTANFENWPKAMITCYQMVTGDEWMDLMDDCSVRPPACTPLFDANLYPDYGYSGPPKSFGDCGSDLAPVYFLAFKLVAEAIMLNLFIGMIIE